MSARAPLLLALVVLAASCLKEWDVGGPWACSDDGTCAAGFTCDDGLCCVPGGSPACPTLPGPQGCADGHAPTVYAEDLDGDGYGNPRVTALLCAKPQARPWVPGPATDCDDRDGTVHPGAPEACNALDDNCDGQLDEGLPGRHEFYRDVDGDGFGDDGGTLLSCGTPAGYVEVAGDCAPFSASRYPGATEFCNGLDDNCNGGIDELPLADVWNAGDALDRFSCDTGRMGVCAAGNFRCVGGQRVCEAQNAATVEICNGLDDNCNGAVDEQPACGGPLHLFTEPDVTFGAERIIGTSATTFTGICPGGYAGATPMTWSNPTWSFTTPLNTDGLHVLWAEAPAGQTWDLSGPNGAFNLAFTATAPSSGWGAPLHTKNPIIYLCGPQPTQLMRYVNAAGALQYNTTTVNEVVPLAGGNGWVIGMGSGFDLSQVKRVEVLVWPLPPDGGAGNYSITFGAATGFTK